MMKLTQRLLIWDMQNSTLHTVNVKMGSIKWRYR